MHNTEEKSRFVVVSNRLPVQIHKHHNKYEITKGTGGLITALEPVLKEKHGLWIGWQGSTENVNLSPHFETFSMKTGYRLYPIAFTEEEIESFYLGFTNEIIWPLFHDLQTRCNFVPEYWQSYLNVNRKFAEETLKLTGENDYIWVHDYHLMHVAKIILEKKINREIVFFLHIPFPSMDIFCKLPWREEILDALLQYNQVGFQTVRDKRNFLNCVRAYLPGAKISGRGAIFNVEYKNRKIIVGEFPISIDFNYFAQLAADQRTNESKWYFNKKNFNYEIILGVDRLDYTKGIIEKLRAFREALRKFPDLIGKLVFMQVIVPSREKVPQYRTLKAEIERLVGKINGEFTLPGWVPINYFYQTLRREDLVAFYKSASIALITPLKDGMNLVAKEYCACNLTNDGVLILSEFAGAAQQLSSGAIVVNPNNWEGVAEAIYKAFTMPQYEKRARMFKLRSIVRKYNVYHWLNSFLHTL